jgi:hypothetical protein
MELGLAALCGGIALSGHPAAALFTFGGVTLFSSVIS